MLDVRVEISLTDEAAKVLNSFTSALNLAINSKSTEVVQGAPEQTVQPVQPAQPVQPLEQPPYQNTVAEVAPAPAAPSTQSAPAPSAEEVQAKVAAFISAAPGNRLLLANALKEMNAAKLSDLTVDQKIELLGSLGVA